MTCFPHSVDWYVSGVWRMVLLDTIGRMVHGSTWGWALVSEWVRTFVLLYPNGSTPQSTGQSSLLGCIGGTSSYVQTQMWLDHHVLPPFSDSDFCWVNVCSTWGLSPRLVLATVWMRCRRQWFCLLQVAHVGMGVLVISSKLDGWTIGSRVPVDIDSYWLQILSIPPGNHWPARWRMTARAGCGWLPRWAPAAWPWSSSSPCPTASAPSWWPSRATWTSSSRR